MTPSSLLPAAARTANVATKKCRLRARQLPYLQAFAVSEPIVDRPADVNESDGTAEINCVHGFGSCHCSSQRYPGATGIRFVPTWQMKASEHGAAGVVPLYLVDAEKQATTPAAVPQGCYCQVSRSVGDLQLDRHRAYDD
ncbi:hypothetical protein [Variovorax sp. GT1P44]|uniref:hypothetical protein n=1 Tax=Variovorax sp. GT1P44 TaxID=3443742 RepID=UPI003F47B07F